MTEPDFQSIWAAMDEIPDFKAREVTVELSHTDLSTHYGIQAVSNIKGEHTNRLYKIPVDDASPAFKQWMKRLGYTGE